MWIREYGGGEQVVVLIHGIPGARAVWSDVAHELADDHRVLVPDLLGFGDSPRPTSITELWADAQARALHQALTDRGVTRAVFAGHNFGGLVALALAQEPGAEDLLAGVCLTATNVFADTQVPLPVRAVQWPLGGTLAARVLFSRLGLTVMLRRGSTRRLDRKQYLGDHAQRQAIATIFRHAMGELDERYAFAEPALRELRVPVLITWGDRDPFFPAAQAHRTAAATVYGRLAIHEGARHFLPAERPHQLAAALRELVRQGTP